MGEEAECSHHRDDSDRSPRSQPTRDGGAGCADRPAADRADERPSVDGLFHLCADRDRRRALYLLDESESAVPIHELVARIAESTPDGSDATGSDPPGGPTSPAEGGTEPGPATDRVLTALHHVHLPKLADAGAVSYDPEAGEVVPTIGERLSAVLEGARSLERPGEHESR